MNPPPTKAQNLVNDTALWATKLQDSFVKLLTPDNLIWLCLGLVLVVFGSILLMYALLVFIQFIRIKIDKIGKGTEFLEIYFDQYINYEDAKFLQIMDNLFKRIDQIIRSNKQIISFEVHKSEGLIKFLVSSSSIKTLEIVKSLLLGIDGVKVNLVPGISSTSSLTTTTTTDTTNPIPILSKAGKIKKVFYKNQIAPVNFKSTNIFSEIVKSLEETSYNDSGCLVIIRSTNYTKWLFRTKRNADRLAKSPKRTDQYYQQEKSKLIIDKTAHGELMQVGIYLYAQNSNQVDNLTSRFASSSFNNQVQVRSLTGAYQREINNRYLEPAFRPLRALIGYSILNSFELSHVIGPVHSNLQNKLNPNLVTIPSLSGIGIDGGLDGGIDASIKGSSSENILINLNNSGDNITEQNAFLNLVAFGDPNSGKSSGFIGSITKSYFNKNYGMLFTVFKSSEVPGILQLAKTNARMNDIILLNKNTLWRTNIINTELNATGSIKNAIHQFEKINKLILNRSSDINGSDPFWDNASKNLFTNLLKVTILFHGSFSFSLFEYISELSGEYARALSSPNPSQIQTQKQIIFENILKSITQNPLEKTGSIIVNREEIKRLVDYFVIDWVNMPEKTRESVYTVFRSNLDALSSGYIANLLLSDLEPNNPNYFEISSTRKGKIIILDFPVSKEKEEGRIFQEIVKGFWQSEMIRHEIGLPCVLVSDEFQQFGGGSDVDFLSVNRSYRIANIFATQNYTSLIDKLGEIKTKKLLGNIQTKFFFQTSDKNTWQYARDIMGEVDTNSYTQNYNENQSTSISSNQRFELLGQHFQQLGMSLPKHQAEAIVFQQGYLFKENKKKYLHVIFNKVEEVVDFTTSQENPKLDIQDSFKPVLKQTQSVEDLVQGRLQSKIKPSKTSKITKSHILDKTEPKVRSDQQDYLSISQITSKYSIGKTKLFKLIKDRNISTIKGTGGRGVAPTLVNRVELERVL